MSRMKCKDCGKMPFEPHDGRDAMCDDCWELRGLLVKAAFTDHTIRPEQFQEVQRRMNNNRWDGANAMREALDLATEPPQPTPRTKDQP